MKKKLLVLGAGSAQIDLIQYAKENGFEVYGVSYTNTDPGIPMLDHFAQINIVDVEKVAAYAKKMGIEYIYSVGSDIAVPTYSRVAEACGLPHFVSGETAEICCNKHLMRGAMKDSCFNVPYLYCSSLDKAKEASFYPLVMKPVDSQGQRGICRVNSFGELARHFADSMSFSRSGQVILEQFIDGDEVSVNAYMADGEIVFCLISDRESFQNFPGGIIKAHHLPSKYEGTETGIKIRSLVKETVKKLKIANGPVYFQIKIEKDHPYLIEVTPRLDGCHMWRLIKLYCGVDLLEITMSHLLGNKPSEISWNPGKRPMHTEFFCEAPGTKFDPEKYESYPCQYKSLYYGKGDIVRRMNGYAEKCGYRIFESPRKVALIGGSGMIGTCFADLYAHEFDVVDVSRSSGAVSEYSDKQLLAALKGCDSAVILAAKKVSGEEKQSLALYEENTEIVENTLMTCKALGIRNVVYLSSRCVYAHDQLAPVAEDGVIAPVNYYGISKYTGEMLCDYYNRKFGFSVKVLRLSQVIGAGGNGYLVDTFLKQAMTGAPLTVYGNAEGRRDYIYVKDACAAIRAALMHYDAAGVYNIGSGVGTSSMEIAKAVVDGLGSSSEIVRDTDKKEDNSLFFLNVKKAKNELSFCCQFDLRSAISDLKERLEKEL